MGFSCRSPGQKTEWREIFKLNLIIIKIHVRGNFCFDKEQKKKRPNFVKVMDVEIILWSLESPSPGVSLFQHHLSAVYIVKSCLEENTL